MPCQASIQSPPLSHTRRAQLKHANITGSLSAPPVLIKGEGVVTGTGLRGNWPSAGAEDQRVIAAHLE